jgi:hypothetical protein
MYKNNFLKFFWAGLWVGVPMVVFSFIADSWYYGEWRWTVWNFLEFNVLTGGSSYFSQDEWYKYVGVWGWTQYGVFYVALLVGFWKVLNDQGERKVIAIVFGTYVAVLSLVGHKESRFLIPVHALGWIFVARWINDSLSKPFKPKYFIIKALVKPQLFKILLIVTILASLFTFIHFTFGINLAYRAIPFPPPPSLFLSNQQTSRHLCDIHPHLHHTK